MEGERRIRIKMPGTWSCKCRRYGEGTLRNLKEAVELYLENAKELKIIKEVDEEFQFPEKYSAPLEVAVLMKPPILSSDDIINILKKAGFVYAPK